MRFHEVRTKSALNHVPGGTRGLPVRVDDQPVPGLHACVRLLLRPPDPRVPGLDAGRDFEREIVVKVNVPEVLRAELGAHVVAGRPDRAGHEHGPVPVGRGPLQADARDLGGDARLPQPVLDPDQVAAGAARPGPAAGDRRGDGRQRVPVGADAGREGVAGDRAAHAEPEGAAGGGGGAQPRRHPDRRADRAADARRQRRARSRWSGSSTRRPRRKATYIGGQTLFLRGAVRDIYFAWLREHRPDLVPRYERLYAKGAYVSAAEKRKIELAAGAPWALRTYPVRDRHRGPRRPPVRAAPRPPRVVQGSLLLREAAGVAARLRSGRAQRQRERLGVRRRCAALRSHRSTA